MIQENYNLVTAITFILSAVITFGMLWIGISQLKVIAKQAKEDVQANSLNRLNSLLKIESQIAERRQILSEAGLQIVELQNTNIQDSVNAAKFEAAKLRLNEAIQMYLNGLDRLCFCVENGYLTDDEIRLEYRDIIHKALQDHPNEFQAASPYRNIKRVHERWAAK